jgi:NAD dependent epimerase/dehydratase family enzyme
VRAIRFLIESESASGPVNVVAPNPLTNAGFGRVLGRVLRRPFLLPIPALPLRLLAGEMSTIVLDGQRAIPRRLQDAGFTFHFPEAEVALRDLLRQGKAPVQEPLQIQVDLNE